MGTTCHAVLAASSNPKPQALLFDMRVGAICCSAVASVHTFFLDSICCRNASRPVEAAADFWAAFFASLLSASTCTVTCKEDTHLIMVQHYYNPQACSLSTCLLYERDSKVSYTDKDVVRARIEEASI